MADVVYLDQSKAFDYESAKGGEEGTHVLLRNAAK